MNKKGITWDTIVYAIIALIVLIALIWMFRSQINEIYQSLTTLIKGSTAGTQDITQGLKELTESK